VTPPVRRSRRAKLSSSVRAARAASGSSDGSFRASGERSVRDRGPIGKRTLEQVPPSWVAVGGEDELDGQLEERREPRAVVGARLSFREPVVGYRSARESNRPAPGRRRAPPHTSPNTAARATRGAAPSRSRVQAGSPPRPGDPTGDRPRGGERFARSVRGAPRRRRRRRSGSRRRGFDSRRAPQAWRFLEVWDHSPGHRSRLRHGRRRGCADAGTHERPLDAGGFRTGAQMVRLRADLRPRKGCVALVSRL
jgi:hypothetical protein